MSKGHLHTRYGPLAFGAVLVALLLAVFARGLSGRASGTVVDWPLRFTHLQFGGACFDTRTCSISYNAFEFGLPQPAPTRRSLSSEQYDSIMSAGYGPVARTAPPARLQWMSKDGATLRAEIDIAAIFADGLIRHSTPQDDIATGVSIGSTHVIVEIDDRSVAVYTRTMIPLKKLLDPANRFSSFRNDLIRVYQRTY